MSVPRLMINIWEYSDHVHHTKHDKKIDRKCEKYLNKCVSVLLQIRGTMKKNFFFLTLLFINFSVIEKNMLF